jgi:hypothetical protein
MNGDKTMFIVGIKKNNELQIVAKKSTRKAVYTINVPYPVNGFLENKKAWYDVYKDAIKQYKTHGSANRMGQDIVSRYNLTEDYEVVELTDDIISNAFDGCPSCGSFEVVETFSTHYNRPLLFDKSNMSVTQTGSANDNGTGEIIRYVCAKCGKDLTDFDFSEFTGD